MFDIGDTVVSIVCPTMAGTITKMNGNRAIIQISRARDYKSMGKEIAIDLNFWKKCDYEH